MFQCQADSYDQYGSHGYPARFGIVAVASPWGRLSMMCWMDPFGKVWTQICLVPCTLVGLKKIGRFHIMVNS